MQTDDANLGSMYNGDSGDGCQSPCTLGCDQRHPLLLWKSRKWHRTKWQSPLSSPLSEDVSFVSRLQGIRERYVFADDWTCWTTAVRHRRRRRYHDPKTGKTNSNERKTSLSVLMFQNVQRYENLAMGCEELESQLKTCFAEYLNAEIVLGTIKNMPLAVEWLKSTFMYIRVLHLFV